MNGIDLPFFGFNKEPILYLGLSLASGYATYRAARQACHNLLDTAFGGESIEDKVKKVEGTVGTKDFSVSSLIFGKGGLSYRTCKLISSIFSSAMATGALFASYFFYSQYCDYHFKPQIPPLRDICFKGLDSYSQQYKEVTKVFNYWKKNLCELDQKYWASTTYEAEGCVYGSSWNSYCEKLLIEEAIERYNRERQPAKIALIRGVALLGEQKRVGKICSDYLVEQAHAVLQHCTTYIYPVFMINPYWICQAESLLINAKTSKCAYACKGYDQTLKVIQDHLSPQIDSTEKVNIDCVKILDEPNFPTKKDPEMGKEYIPDSTKEKILPQLLKSYNQDNWRNTTAIKINNYTRVNGEFEELCEFAPNLVPNCKIAVKHPAMQEEITNLFYFVNVFKQEQLAILSLRKVYKYFEDKLSQKERDEFEYDKHMQVR